MAGSFWRWRRGKGEAVAGRVQRGADAGGGTATESEGLLYTTFDFQIKDCRLFQTAQCLAELSPVLSVLPLEQLGLPN